jgi:hypothetical protein
MTTNLKELVGSLYDLLEPVDPADRKKAIKATMTMLGDAADLPLDRGGKSGDADDDGDSDLPAKARQWMKKYDVTQEHLNHVFHVENGTAEVIAHEAPGSSTKAKTINGYVLTGISQLLAKGEAKFDDKTARAVCKTMGCFNEGNHATYMKEKGNVLGGSKDSGWTLTGPGLKSGADLIKELASE